MAGVVANVLVAAVQQGAQLPRVDTQEDGGLRRESEQWFQVADQASGRLVRYTRADSQHWGFRFESCLAATHAGFHQVVSCAESRLTIIHAVHAEGDFVDAKQHTNIQFHYILLDKVDGEAFDKVKNTERQNGAKAWRRTCK